MTNLLIIFQVFSFLAIFPIVFVVLKYSHNKIRDRYQPLAEQYGGEVMQPNFFTSPRIRIPLQQASVLIHTSPGSKNSPSVSMATTAISVPEQFKLHIWPEGFGSKVAKFFGVKDIQLHNPPFDEEYVVQSEDEMTVRNLLSSELQQALFEIRDRKPNIKIEKGRVSFFIHEYSKDNERLREFIDNACSVLQLFKDRLQSAEQSSNQYQPRP